MLTISNLLLNIQRGANTPVNISLVLIPLILPRKLPVRPLTFRIPAWKLGFAGMPTPTVPVEIVDAGELDVAAAVGAGVRGFGSDAEGKCWMRA